MTATTVRWPLQPLLDAAGVSRKGLLARVGGATSSVYWASEYGLTDEQADRWSLACDLMPHEVWDGWFDAALTELDKAFLNSGWRPAWLWLEAARGRADTPELTPSAVTVPAMTDEEAA